MADNIFEKNKYYRIFGKGVIGCGQYNYYIIGDNIKPHDEKDEIISFKSEREAYDFLCKIRV